MSAALFTLGCDPELIPTRKKLWIPAWELTSGTKANPQYLAHPENNIGLKVQADGVALEFNIDPVTINNPDDCIARWPSVIEHALNLIMGTYDVRLESQPLISLEHYKSSETFKHPLCQASGCDPDYDAYAENPVRSPLDFSTLPTYRFSGGHVHVGYDLSMCPPDIFARFMDLFVGLELRDPQSTRRRFYGQAGIFRPKPYGMEYRTLSSMWVKSHQGCSWVARGILALVHALKNYPEEMRQLYRETNWPLVKRAIESEVGGLRQNQLESRDAFFGRNCPESYELSPARDNDPRPRQPRVEPVFPDPPRWADDPDDHPDQEEDHWADEPPDEIQDGHEEEVADEFADLNAAAEARFIAAAQRFELMPPIVGAADEDPE